MYNRRISLALKPQIFLGFPEVLHIAPSQQKDHCAIWPPPQHTHKHTLSTPSPWVTLSRLGISAWINAESSFSYVLHWYSYLKHIAYYNDTFLGWIYLRTKNVKYFLLITDIQNITHITSTYLSEFSPGKHIWKHRSCIKKCKITSTQKDSHPLPSITTSVMIVLQYLDF